MNSGARRLLWGLAIAGTLVAVAWVDSIDEEVAAPGPERRGGERKAGDKATPPVLRLEALDARGLDAPKGDLFAARSWYVAPPPPPAPKPSAPALPFTYAGRMVEDGAATVFLSARDRNHAVRSGDVIDQQWRVDAIGATTMTLTYLPLNLAQTLNLGAAP
jgi:hypothetical protein